MLSAQLRGDYFCCARRPAGADPANVATLRERALSALENKVGSRFGITPPLAVDPLCRRSFFGISFISKNLKPIFWCYTLGAFAHSYPHDLPFGRYVASV